MAGDVVDEACGQCGREPEDAEVAVLGVGLDQELAMLGVEGWLQFQQIAADGEGTCGGVEVVGAEFGQLAPPGTGLDGRVQPQPPPIAGQCVAQSIELGGGQDTDRGCDYGGSLYAATGCRKTTPSASAVVKIAPRTVSLPALASATSDRSIVARSGMR